MVSKAVGGQRSGKGVAPKASKDCKSRKGFLKELRIPTKSCSGSETGWVDTSEKFVNTPPDAKREAYFQTFGKSCFYKLGEGKIPDDILRNRLGDWSILTRNVLSTEISWGRYGMLSRFQKNTI